jgi:hypothetical protein
VEVCDVTGKQQDGQQQGTEPFDRAEFAAEVAGEVREKGADDLAGVAKYYRMAGLPAKKALEMAAAQAADVMTRYLTQGMIAATVEAMDVDGGKGPKTWKIGPAKPLRVGVKPWELYLDYVVKANGIEIARPRIDYDVEVRLEILEAGLTRWPDGGYELSLGRARLGCLVYLLRPDGTRILIANPKTREVSFAEPISWGGTWTPEEERPACPFGSPAACPYGKPGGGAPSG